MEKKERNHSTPLLTLGLIAGPFSVLRTLHFTRGQLDTTFACAAAAAAGSVNLSSLIESRTNAASLPPPIDLGVNLVGI